MATMNISDVTAGAVTLVGNSLGNASLPQNESGNITPPEDLDQTTCSIYDFIIEAVLMGLLCIFGFCGNTLSILCLNRDKSKTATPFLLVSLELADTLFLVTVLILRVLTSLQTFTYALPWLVDVFPYVGKFIFPCAMISETATIYLTLLVTVNRYISVCRPYEASNLCSIQHARKHVIIVVFCAIAYNLPRFFEYQLEEVFDTKMNKSIYITVPTNMTENRFYQIIYSNVLYFLVLFCVPLVTLIILNYRLITALRKAKKKRAQLLNSSSSDSNRSEDDITLVLIVVVLVFVICQTPALVTQLLMVLLPPDTQNCPYSFFYYVRISDLLVVANSSLNFLIYCFCSRKFRQILTMLVCKTRLDSPEPSHASRHYKQVPTNTTMSTFVTKAVVVTNGNTAMCEKPASVNNGQMQDGCETKVSTL